VKPSIYIYIIPGVTIAAAALVLREPVTTVSAVGMALILAGMVLSDR
jgi:drug/metabolite transporter (DMT)-like permease